MATTAVLSATGVPWYSDGGEAGEPADIGVGDGLPQDLLGSRRPRGLLPRGGGVGYVTVGVAAATVSWSQVQGVQDLADGGVTAIFGADAVRGVVSGARIAVSLGGAGWLGVRGVVLIFLTFPGESSPDGSKEADPLQLPGRGRGGVGRHAPAAVLGCRE